MRMTMEGLEPRMVLDGAYHQLLTSDLVQDWSNTTLIDVDDDWSSIPSIIGFRGDGGTATVDVDPQTVLAPLQAVVDVMANEIDPDTLVTGGVAEFDTLPDPVVALQPSATADAPFLQLHLDTTDVNGVRLRYRLRDIDNSGDNAVQQVAIQYRVGVTGDFVNVPAGFVADASVGPNLTQDLGPLTVVLPDAVNDKPQVQVRILSSNAGGSDEWIGIDDIEVSGAPASNQPPDAVDGPNQTTTESTVLNVVADDGAVSNDTDPNGDTLTIISVNGLAVNVGNQFQLPSGALLTVNPDGSYSYDPNGAFDGLNDNGAAPDDQIDDTFTYTVSDQNVGTDSATVAITITGEGNGDNFPPRAVDDQFTTPESQFLNILPLGVLANDIEPNLGQILRVSEVNGIATDVGRTIVLASGASLRLNANGSFFYNPSGVFNGLNVGETFVDTFTYTASDLIDSDSATVSIVITGQGAGGNFVPIAADDNFIVDEDQLLNVVPPGVLGNDLDPNNGQTLTVSQLNGSAGDVDVFVTLPSGARVRLTTTGALVYDPNGAFDGLNIGDTAVDTFTYTITDGAGGTDTATVFVTISGQGAGGNFPPNADDDAYTTPEDTLLSVDAANGVLDGDTDPNVGDVLTVTQINGAPLAGQIVLPSGALLTMNPDGSFDYDPNGQFDELNAGDTDIDTFTYRVSDLAGADDTAVVTITITGLGVGGNVPPRAADDTGMVDETGPPLTVNAPGVLANDTDPNFLDVGNLTVVAVNDTGPVGAAINLPSGAVVTVNANGSYTYDPNGAFDGLNAGDQDTDVFTYTVGDGRGGFDTASVTITINGLGTGGNQPPRARDDSASVAENGLVNQPPPGVLANDRDANQGDVIRVQALNGDPGSIGVATILPSGATVTLNQNGSYLYNPSPAFDALNDGEFETDTFTYTIEDSFGATDTAVVTIAVTGLGAGGNSPPKARDDARTTPENQILTEGIPGILINDSDPNLGDTLRIMAVNKGSGVLGAAFSLPSGALLTLNQFGNFTYDPNGVFDGLNAGDTDADTFTYTLSDSNGLTDTASVTITITGLGFGGNVPPKAIDDDATVVENSSINATAPGVLANDFDPNALDAGNVVVSLVNGTTAPGAVVGLTSGAIVRVNVDGSYIYDPNGAFDGLNAGDTDTDTFTYAITDGRGLTDTATVTVTIIGLGAGGNVPPKAQDDQVGPVDEDDVLQIAAPGVLGNDRDPNSNDSTTVSGINGDGGAIGAPFPLPSGALVTMQTNGSFDYDPNGAFDGLNAGDTDSDTFTYTVTDSKGGTDTATVTVTISGVGAGGNVPPKAQDDDLVAIENVLLNINAPGVLANDRDPNRSDTITISEVNGVAADVGVAINLPSGAGLTVSGNGSLTYNALPVFAGLNVGDTDADSFTYTITDGRGGTDTATATITIQGVGFGGNLPPRAQPDTAATREDQPLSVPAAGVLANDSDPNNGNVLTVDAVNGDITAVNRFIPIPSGALLRVNTDGSFEYDPNGAFNGLNAGDTDTDTFTYTVTDGNGGTDTSTTTVTINGVGVGGNVPPKASDDTETVDENLVRVVGPAGVLANDFDPNNGQTLQVTELNGDPSALTVATPLPSGALVTLNPDGSYQYDPNGVFDGLNLGDTDTDTFTYTISDGLGGTDTATVTLTINGIGAGGNVPPRATDDAYQTFEFAALNVPFATGVLANDRDPNVGNLLRVAAVNGQPADVGFQVPLPSGALLVLRSDGSFVYNPNGAFNGLNFGDTTVDTFDYTLSDGRGGTDNATVRITIDGAGVGGNIPPTAVDDVNITQENIVINLGAGAGVLSNDIDPNQGQTLSVRRVNDDPLSVGVPFLLPSGARLRINSDGSYLYNPNGAFNGLNLGDIATDAFTYQVSDAAGGFDTGTVTVTINGIGAGGNIAPAARDDTGAVDERDVLNVPPSGVLANDRDPNNGDTISVSAINGNAAALGAPFALPSGAVVTLNTDGSYVYNPNGAFNGLNVGDTDTDTFTYTIRDNAGLTDTATVTITIGGVGVGGNTAPRAADDQFTTPENQFRFVLAPGVLLNDRDPNRDQTPVVLAVNGSTADIGNAASLPSGAVVTLQADGSFVYNPNAAFDGLNNGDTETDTFTYTITDANGGTDTATVTMTITGVGVGGNRPPIAANDFNTTAENAVLNVLPTGLLANDIDPNRSDVLRVSAINGDPTAVPNTITLPSGALLRVNGNGSYIYNPNGAFDGLNAGDTDTDVFLYTVTDNRGATDAATVTITITGVGAGGNASPQAQNDTGRTNEGTPLFVAAPGVLANDRDPNVGDALLVGAVNGDPGTVGLPKLLPSGAIVTMVAGGAYTYDPNGAFDGLNTGDVAADSFAYTITDLRGGQDTATVTITIDGLGQLGTVPPRANDDAFTVAENVTLIAPTPGVLFNDADLNVADILRVNELNGNPLLVNVQTTLPSGALLTISADGSFNYNPNGVFDPLNVGETNTDSFTYTITDGNGGTDSASVTINITGVGTGGNSAPNARDDAFSTNENQILNQPAPGALQNDFDPNAADAIFVSAVNGNGAAVGATTTLPSGAALLMNADGSFVYDPGGAFDQLGFGETDIDTFTYTIVDDGGGGSDSATVSITINGLAAGGNSPPVANIDRFIVFEGALLNRFVPGVLGNDTDPNPNDVLSVLSVNGDVNNVNTAFTLPSGAILQLNTDGSFNYNQNGAFNGLNLGDTDVDTFTYTVTDGAGGTDDATVVVRIDGLGAGGNVPPRARDDFGAVNENTLLQILRPGLLGNDDDPNRRDTLRVISVNGNPMTLAQQFPLASGAIVTVSPTGAFTYDPDGAFDGLNAGDIDLDSFSYAISDGRGATDSARVTITINGIGAGGNVPPRGVDDFAVTGENDPPLFVPAPGVLGNDIEPNQNNPIPSQPDADTLTVLGVNGNPFNAGFLVDLPSGAVVTVNPDGSYVYDANGAFDPLNTGETNTDTFTYLLADNHGATSTATVTITITGDGVGGNSRPNLVDDAFAMFANQLLNVPLPGVLANDSDPNPFDSLITIAVNGDVTAIGAPFTLPSGALLTQRQDGSFVYNPNGVFDPLFAGEFDTDTFTYTASDANGATDTATVIIRINGVTDFFDGNSPPNAVDDRSFTRENQVLQNAASVLGNDRDPNAADTLQVVAVNGTGFFGAGIFFLPTGAILVMNNNGTYSYNPNGRFNSLNFGEFRRDTFSYTISDGNGGQDTADVTVVINGVGFGQNSPPVAFDDAARTTEARIVVEATPGVLVNDRDPNRNDVIQVAAVNGNPAAVGAQVALPSGALLTVQADGAYIYDPNGAFDQLNRTEVDFDAFTYTITDGNGLTDAATVTITIDGLGTQGNRPPVAEPDAFNIFEDQTLALAPPGLIANDRDPQVLDVLEIIEVNGSQLNVGSFITLPSGALLLVRINGSLIYNPNGAFDQLNVGEAMTDTFTYTLTDNSAETDTATVTITINGLGTDGNTAPGAVDDAFNVNDNQLLNVPFPGVLQNDSDFNGDTLQTAAINGDLSAVAALFTLPSGSIITMQTGGGFVYDHQNRFIGLNPGESVTDRFTYTITDGRGGTDTATISITINGQVPGGNSPPLAVDDDLQVDEDAQINLAPMGLLGNDQDGNGDPLTISAVNGSTTDVGSVVILPRGDLLVVNLNGSMIYDPNGRYDGLNVGDSLTTSFTYTVTDGQGGSDEADVVITINGVGTGGNIPPTAFDDQYAIDENEFLSVAASGVLINDFDPNRANVLTVSALEGDNTAVGRIFVLESDVQLRITRNGAFTYNQGNRFDGMNIGDVFVDTFQYQVADGAGGFDTATATVTITGRGSGGNAQPVARSDSFQTLEGQAIDLPGPGVLLNDVDPNAGDVLSVISLNGNANRVGTLTILPSGASLTINADGSLVYDPGSVFSGLNTGQTAVDSFSYGISDGNGKADAAQVVITIIGVDGAPPEAASRSASTPENQVLDQSGDDMGADGEANSYTVVAINGDTAAIGNQITLPSGAMLTAEPDGSYSYDPHNQWDYLDPQETATDSFTYTIRDEHGLTDTGAITVTIEGVQGTSQWTLEVVDQGPNKDLVFTGSNSRDVVLFYPRGAQQRTMVRVNGVDYGPYDITGKIIAHGLGGEDLISASLNSPWPAEFHGGDEYDRLYGTNLDDQLFGDDGRDRLEGQRGNDRLDGGVGNDVVYGNHGDDILIGGEGHDILNGGIGDDLLRGGVGRDKLLGSYGNDILLGGAESDRLYAHFGYNLLIGGGSRDLLDAGANSDGGILIGGSTSHDANDTALLALLADWKSSTGMAARQANLRDRLTLGEEVFNDDQWNHLVGSPGDDWFFKYRKDLLFDVGPNDDIEQP